MKKGTMVNFYLKNKISPVRQDIKKLYDHFQRREALYRQLGILSEFMYDRNIMEVGPGSGFNSLYVASLQPKQLVLIEPNPQGVKDINELFSKYDIGCNNISIISKTVEDYSSYNSETYNFVFCEGLLGAAGVESPCHLFHTLADFVCPGGVLVVTCMDEISYLSELIRRLFAHMIICDIAGVLSDKVEILLPSFSPHLELLEGMTRRYDDWIIDNLFNPSIYGPLFTIADALTALPEQLEFYSSSPHFVTDWRWYKDIYGPNRNFNQIALQQYWENIHNLLDYRFTFPPRDVTLNKQLYQICKSIRHNIQQYENNPKDDILQTIRDELKNCIHNVNDFSPETALSLQEALDLLSVEKIEANDVAEMRKFAGFFGRGQQYLSFTKRNVDNNAMNFGQNGIIS
ncbi:MAG: class I SAM-dependent methyltransferase [Candidatus Thermoplasmatota archaeon]|nr:class I SAM-dependent methyltransferase [Candidatus Thermoplasmatota archaeon]